jgi:hypothetical protein
MACVAFMSNNGLSIDVDPKVVPGILNNAGRPVVLFGWGGIDYTYDFQTDKLTRSEWVLSCGRQVPLKSVWRFLDLPLDDRIQLLAFICPD